ncbi:hypothetical protein [Pedosphaera parvula]|uniref:Calcium-binding EF-hand-containing protein n=1 Tax=Pedosphaera parvula (strain Ellin514) TaxID=320771 RepID=B9XQI6_PEDPL|nr:hypothetical protein [Pedosphaera parvula]EEF57911.1 Calcium-binding EF-hand-containing protein [Pedosphaera parvula Ellin514]
MLASGKTGGSQRGLLELMLPIIHCCRNPAFIQILVFCCVFSGGIAQADFPGKSTDSSSIRVAMMDFSTDDNSYRNAQAAADFASMLQTRLQDEPGIEWVERTQLELAGRELGLAELGNLGETAPVRRGKWAKAEWLLTGEFSHDDQNRRTLSFEVTDLQHADTLVTQTLILPEAAGENASPQSRQLEAAAETVHQILALSRSKAKEASHQVLVAPLFFADLSTYERGTEILQREFFQALQQATKTNSQIRIVRFPKAYQSMDEAEMVLEGFAEADLNAWRHSADLYVWGSYTTSNMQELKGANPKLMVTVNVWDGVLPFKTFKQEVVLSKQWTASPEQITSLLHKATQQILSQAGKHGHQTDTSQMRHAITEEILKTYTSLESQGHPTMGLHNKETFIQAVHMLETACFFEPGNSKAHALRISCRWGFWVDFGFTVKSEFWSKWRRSVAWGKYVDQFGLGETVTLPFPYGSQGISAPYLSSLDEVLRMWATHNKAQAYGFPADIPPALEKEWKQQIDAEHWKRLCRVADYFKTNYAITNNIDKNPAFKISPLRMVLGRIFEQEDHVPERLRLIEGVWPLCIEFSKHLERTRILPTNEEQTLRKWYTQVGKPTEADKLLSSLFAFQTSTPPSRPVQRDTRPAVHLPAPAMVQKPSATGNDWLRQVRPMFNLNPPRLLPTVLNPTLQSISFPEHEQLQVIRQLLFHQEKLWILAESEASAQSSSEKPEISAEMHRKMGKLWCYDVVKSTLSRCADSSLPENIQSMAPGENGIWLGGSSLGFYGLNNTGARSVGLADGFNLHETDGLTAASDGAIYVTGDFKLLRLKTPHSRWESLPLPPASFSRSNDRHPFLAANGEWLCLSSGSTLIYDLTRGSWKNLNELPNLRCMTPDASAFWMGTAESLDRLTLDNSHLEHWKTPTSEPGISLQESQFYFANTKDIPERKVEEARHKIFQGLKSLQSKRNKLHGSSSEPSTSSNDPLHLDARLPDGVSALANDGDFLWVAIRSYPYYVMLLHKPSLAWISCFKLDREVSSLAVSREFLWVGTPYSDSPLQQVKKQDLLAVPKENWLSLGITPGERNELIEKMPLRARALFALYAGNDSQVAALLKNKSVSEANLEELFLLAFSHDTLGVNDPETVREAYGEIIRRFPESPWSQFAEEATFANYQEAKQKDRERTLLAKYDRNKNGILDPKEREAMEKDPDYVNDERSWHTDQLSVQIREIFKRSDLNHDGRLDEEELKVLRQRSLLYAEASPEMIKGKKIVFAPLISRDFPSVSLLLKQYDANHDGYLDENELRTFAGSFKQAETLHPK